MDRRFSPSSYDLRVQSISLRKTVGINAGFNHVVGGRDRSNSTRSRSNSIRSSSQSEVNQLSLRPNAQAIMNKYQGKPTSYGGFGIMDTLISLAGRTGTLRSSLLPSISESAKPRSMSFTAAESKTVVTPSFGRSGALRFSAGG